MSRQNTSDSILRYTKTRLSQKTVLRHYLKWRESQSPPLPIRCDNPACQFYTQPLVWNGQPFKLILDHTLGVNSDNRPKSLRLLCPLCDSQLPTRGGGNKGRVVKSEGGFARISGDVRHYDLFPQESGTVIAQINEFDVSQFRFDNNVLVLGADVHIMCRDGNKLPIIRKDT